MFFRDLIEVSTNKFIPVFKFILCIIAYNFTTPATFKKLLRPLSKVYC